MVKKIIKKPKSKKSVVKKSTTSIAKKRKLQQLKLKIVKKKKLNVLKKSIVKKKKKTITSKKKIIKKKAVIKPKKKKVIKKKSLSTIEKKKKLIKLKKSIARKKKRLIKLKKSIKKKKTARINAKTKPNLSTKKELNDAVNRANLSMNKNMSVKDKKLLALIINKFKNGDDTKKLYYQNNRYVPQRRNLHNKIIRTLLREDTRSKSPDLYIFGGVGGSGKGTHLGKYVREKAVTLNNDDIKSELAKATPSGSKRFFLLHAALLHREAKDVEEKALIALLRGKRDIILDRTLSNYNKNLAIVKNFIGNGYEITTLGTNLKPHIAVSRSTKRFLRGKEGRYVPVDKIAKVGNKINKNTLRMAKQPFNKNARVVNTYHRKPTTIYEK